MMNKRNIAIGASILLAFAVGYYFGLRLTFREGVKRALSSLDDQQYFAAALSVATLERLEDGDVDAAKRLAAMNLASYYRSNVRRTDPARSAEVRGRIEKLSDHSPILKEKLGAPPP